MMPTLFAACQALPMAGMTAVARLHGRYRRHCRFDTFVATGAAVPGLSRAGKALHLKDVPAARQNWTTTSPTRATPEYL